MIKIYIAEYKAKDCYDSCVDLFRLLKSYNIKVKCFSYKNMLEIEDSIQITFIQNTKESLAGLRCDCIVGVSDHEKYKIEYGSEYNHIFKNIKTKARLINEIVCSFRKGK